MSRNISVKFRSKLFFIDTCLVYIVKIHYIGSKCYKRKYGGNSTSALLHTSAATSALLHTLLLCTRWTTINTTLALLLQRLESLICDQEVCEADGGGSRARVALPESLRGDRPCLQGNRCRAVGRTVGSANSCCLVYAYVCSNSKLERIFSNFFLN